MLGEGDDQQAGVGLGLGEGSVVAAGAADQGAAGAAAAGRQQVAVAFAVEEGRAWQAADQPVGAVASVDVVGTRAGLDQVVLGPGLDRVVAEAAGEADVPTSSSEPSTRKLSLPGPRSAISQRAGPLAGQIAAEALPGACESRGRSRSPWRPDAEGLGHFVVGDKELVAAPPPISCRPAPPPGVGSSWT